MKVFEKEAMGGPVSSIIVVKTETLETPKGGNYHNNKSHQNGMMQQTTRRFSFLFFFRPGTNKHFGPKRGEKLGCVRIKNTQRGRSRKSNDVHKTQIL